MIEVKCKVFGHQWRIKQRSNVIQYDDMGYPLRLFICECKYCKKLEQMWIDTEKCKNDVVLQWSDYIPIMLKDGKICDEYRNELNEWIKKRIAESEDK